MSSNGLHFIILISLVLTFVFALSEVDCKGLFQPVDAGTGLYMTFPSKNKSNQAGATMQFCSSLRACDAEGSGFLLGIQTKMLTLNI